MLGGGEVVLFALAACRRDMPIVDVKTQWDVEMQGAYPGVQKGC